MTDDPVTRAWPHTEAFDLTRRTDRCAAGELASERQHAQDAATTASGFSATSRRS